jgi:hypothetical protein
MLFMITIFFSLHSKKLNIWTGRSTKRNIYIVLRTDQKNQSKTEITHLREREREREKARLLNTLTISYNEEL